MAPAKQAKLTLPQATQRAVEVVRAHARTHGQPGAAGLLEPVLAAGGHLMRCRQLLVGAACVLEPSRRGMVAAAPPPLPPAAAAG
jgi:hypothetical protein